MENTSLLSPLYLFLSLVLMLVLNQVAYAAKPPAIFILGDSTADVGTNNFLPNSQARADFPHYGVDFPHARPTGRFSNGLNSADFLAKFFGHRRSPRPFLSLGDHLRFFLQKHSFRGLNFASAGSGLLDATGSTLGVVNLSEQIKQFAAVQDSLHDLVGSAATEELFCKSLFFISIGSNDIFGYFQTNSTIPPEEFIGLLMKAYETSIRTLYDLGARKFGFISVPPVGCCPSQRLFNETGGCLEPPNGFARIFYSALDSLLCNISSELPGMKYSLGNAYQMTMDVVQNPYPSNFTNVDTACCGFGKLNAQLPCNPTANLCSERGEYLFWDLFHPTQAAALLAAQTLFTGPPKYVTPITFSQLAEDN